MDLSNVTLEVLQKKHPERVKWESKWADYLLAYRGGYEFLLAAGQQVNRYAMGGSTSLDRAFADQFDVGEQTRRFLWQLAGEPSSKYSNRWQRAAYVNYLAAIIDFFRHWLYSQPPQIRPAEQKDVPDWWDNFYADAVGNGSGLIDVARESFLDVLLFRRAGWLITKVENPEEGASPVRLTCYSAPEILDWQLDDAGQLDWILLCKEESRREWPEDRYCAKVVTYLDREQWHSWEIREDKKELEYIEGMDHGLGAVPFVLREIPHGLWVADKLFAPCMSLFNRAAMLEYAEHVGCYLQPYIRGHEGENAQSRILGEGILLHLRAAQKDRAQEDYGWISPDIGPIAHLAERLRQDRDELYRSVHQMALAVDSQAVGAIARSGASKIEDRRATEVILAGYGKYELRSLVQTANLISKIMGDGLTWVGDGFENFQTSTLDEELQIAALAQAFNIKSATFSAELQKMIATGRVLPHLDEATKQKIEDEIDEAAEEPAEVQIMGPDGKPLPPGADQEPPEEETEEQESKRSYETMDGGYTDSSA